MAVALNQKFKRESSDYDIETLIRDLLLLVDELNAEIERLETRIAALESA